ncbi:MAG: alanine racemase [Phycisphaerales bacterium]|nr:alanine racemase [Phycisphaerales bacterium]MCB9854153.1 alanine racemase [Phycisphaerales bacterium]MCB9864711.1 alanine racemase [Phycisphaerales bacterium]
MRSDLIAQINIDALLHNLDALRRKCAPGVRVCAPLKADAYGHGMSIVAPTLQSAGVDFAAVATVREAVELRTIGWAGEILVLGNVLANADHDVLNERVRAMVDHELTATIVDATGLRKLETYSPAKPIPVHLKVDTGMGRMGVLATECGELAMAIAASPSARFTGVYSHFATADFELQDMASRQLEQFHSAIEKVRPYGEEGFQVHLANSAATITMPDAHFDMVRPGLALYGYAPAAHMRKQINLRPILRLVSHVAMIKSLPADHCVGYSRTFVTRRASRIGIVPIGYHDGFLRKLSNNAVVGTPAGPAPVIGRVSMDQLAIDITDFSRIDTGAQIVLIDPDPAAENSVDAIATRLDTISYEVTCTLGARIDRTQIRDNSDW